MTNVTSAPHGQALAVQTPSKPTCKRDHARGWRVPAEETSALKKPERERDETADDA